MRIATQIDDSTAAEISKQMVSRQMRLALGSYAAEVKSVAVRVTQTESAVECEIRAHLRGRRVVELATTGRSFEEALRFASQRVAATVARRLGNDRALGS